MKYLKKQFEIFLIKIASKILIERNLARSSFVSRRDNNDMWYMSEKLDAICKRMADEYSTIEAPKPPEPPPIRKFDSFGETKESKSRTREWRKKNER